MGVVQRVLVCLALGSLGCDHQGGPPPAEQKPIQPQPPAAERPTPPTALAQRAPDLRDQMEAAPSLIAALELAKPKMADTVNELSDGTFMLVWWARDKMTWADVGIAKNETSFGKVKKDSEAERGKRMCASVSIIQIEKVDSKMYTGLASTGSWEIVRFFAVGNTGELV